MSRTRHLRPLLPILALSTALAGCGKDQDASADPKEASIPIQERLAAHDPRGEAAKPVEVDHDFGILDHGTTASHDLVLEVPPPEEFGGAWIPLRYTRNCSCARHQFVIVEGDGSNRYPTGQPIPEFAVRDGERLEIHVEIHTEDKEAVDLDPVVIPGFVTLQTEAPPHTRKEIPVRIRFGIRSPVVVAPAATIDLGKLPPALRYTRSYFLSGKGRAVAFSNPVCTEPDPETLDGRRVVDDVELALEPHGDGRTRLAVTMQPSPDRPRGPFSMRVDVDTDLPDGYVLRLPMSGFVIPDIELEVPGKLLFGQIDFSEPDAQSLFVTDHVADRPAGFVPLSIVSHDGEDLSPHFTCTVHPVEDRPRTQKIELRYRGTLTNRSFVRGTVSLAKDPFGPVVESVEFVAFRRR